MLKDHSKVPCIKHIDKIHIAGRDRAIERFHIELIHVQLPLPVPCYDLLPVTDLTLVPREVSFWVLPAPLS